MSRFLEKSLVWYLLFCTPHLESEPCRAPLGQSYLKLDVSSLQKFAPLQKFANQTELHKYYVITRLRNEDPIAYFFSISIFISYEAILASQFLS